MKRGVCCRLRVRLPHLPGANDLDIGKLIDGANQRKLLMETMETQSGTPLKTLNSGQRVLVQNPISKSWDKKGIVLDVRPDGRSYEVNIDSGKFFVRNRAFLRPISDSPLHQDSQLSNSPPDSDEPATLRRSSRLAKKT